MNLPIDDLKTSHPKQTRISSRSKLVEQQIMKLYPTTHVTPSVSQFYHDMYRKITGQQAANNAFKSVILPSPPKIISDTKIAEIRNRSIQGEQGTNTWLKQRMKYLTASVIANALGIKGPAARTNLIKEKVNRVSEFFGGAATHWGSRYEDIVDLVYEDIHQCKIHHLGLIKHKTVDFLAASSDGLSNTGINLEIKCPPTRMITGKIPIQYWNQMQLQMHVLEVPLSHFIECSFEEWDFSQTQATRFINRKHPAQYGWWDEWYDSAQDKLVYHGELAPKTAPNATTKTDGPPPWIWPVDQPPKPMKDGLIWLRRCGWSLEQIKIQNVEQDQDWLELVLPDLTKFWNEVLYYRKHPGKMPKTGLNKALKEDRGTIYHRNVRRCLLKHN